MKRHVAASDAMRGLLEKFQTCWLNLTSETCAIALTDRAPEVQRGHRFPIALLGRVDCQTQQRPAPAFFSLHRAVDCHSNIGV
jgi:hypothetical protein